MTEPEQYTLILSAHPDGVQAIVLGSFDTELASAVGQNVAYAVMNAGVQLEAQPQVRQALKADY